MVPAARDRVRRREPEAVQFSWGFKRDGDRHAAGMAITFAAFASLVDALVLFGLGLEVGQPGAERVIELGAEFRRGVVNGFAGEGFGG